MSGTVSGGKNGSAKILARDPDFFKKIGAKGGKKTGIKGFAAMPKSAVSAAGKKGGAISRRGSKKLAVTLPERQQAATQSEVNREYLALPGTLAADLEKDKEADEIIEKLTKDIMSYEQPKRPRFFDRFKKARV